MSSESDSGLFGRMKNIIRMITPSSGETSSPAPELLIPDSELNFAPRSARADAACEALGSLLKKEILSSAPEERLGFYRKAFSLADESVCCMEMNLQSRSVSAKQFPELAFCRIMRNFFEMLAKCAELAENVSSQEKAMENFAGLLPISRLRGAKEASSAFEVSLFQDMSALFEQMTPAMFSARNTRRRSMSHSAQQRYQKAFSEFIDYFTEKQNGLPPGKTE